MASVGESSIEPGAVARSVAQLPAPGHGATADRLAGLAALARRDLVSARLAEAHADAVAICAELGAPGPGDGELWGVWAAGGPPLELAVSGGTLRLSGSKPWCSGAHLCTHALVTVGDRLVAVELASPGVHPQDAEWAGLGMRAADTGTVGFDDVAVASVGAAGDYLTRPGFWHGAIGVAACWYGGAQAVADQLLAAHRRRALHDHARAHVGAVAATLTGAWGALRGGADFVDAHPTACAQPVALAVREVVERAATDVMDRTGRALGPAPMAQDARHSQLLADLSVYVRQSHAERDLDTLGTLLLDDEGAGATGLPWPGVA